MILKIMVVGALTINAYLGGSAGSAAASAGKTSLVGSGGVQELMEQQSACMVSGTSERPWEFKTGKNPESAVFSPDGKLLAVANFSSHNIFVYRVDANGSLAPVQGSPFAVGVLPRPAVFSPDGKLLAVANNYSYNVSVYRAYGSFAPRQGSLFAAGRLPVSAAFSPDGKLLAVPKNDSNNVSVYTVTADGILAPVQGSPFAAGNSPRSAVFSPDGKLLAVSNGHSSNVSVYKVVAGGILEPVQGSPFATGNKSNPRSAVFSPDGKLLAVSNGFSNNVSVYKVVAGGILEPVQGSPFATGKVPVSAAFSPDGKLLAVANYGDNTIWMYEVDPDTGAISPITGGELKATKKEQYEEAHKILVETTPPILNKDIVENVLQGFIVGEKPIKKQEKRDKDSKESDDAIQQKIKRTKEQEASREQDQAKLFEAIKKDDEKGVAEYLTPFTVNAKDTHYETPLIVATKLENAAIVQQILNYTGEIVREDRRINVVKADLQATDNNGNTALLLAITNNKNYTIAILIAEKMSSKERKEKIKDASALVYVEEFQKKNAIKGEYEKLKKLLEE